MKDLLILLIFAVTKQNCISADDLSIQNAVKQFLNQIDEIRKRVDDIIQVNNDIQQGLPTILNEKVSTELEKHPVVLQAQKYLNSSKEDKYLSRECEDLFNSKYNSLKTKIYEKLYKNIVGYYNEIKHALTTRFEEELKEFERRVKDLYKSPDNIDFLTTKMNRAFKVVSNIEAAQDNIIVKTLDYFQGEDSAQFIYDNLFVTFTECLQRRSKINK